MHGTESFTSLTLKSCAAYHPPVSAYNKTNHTFSSKRDSICSLTPSDRSVCDRITGSHDYGYENKDGPPLPVYLQSCNPETLSELIVARHVVN